MELNTFKPESLEIKKLLGDANSLYQIPKYQRPYSWQDEQVEKLWDDITTAFLNNKDDSQVDYNYFLGSIIVVPQSNGYQDVVDGQQRLTTLMILLCVVRDLYPGINKDLDINVVSDAIRITRIKSCIYDEDERFRLKLMTHPAHQGDFESTILKKIDLENIKKPSKNKIKNDPQARFLNTAFILHAKLVQLGEKVSGELINYLFNKVRIIKITCTDTTFAIKLFQVLNDRGMDLTSSDLIKSFLLSKINDENRHAQFIADWQRIEDISKDSDLGMDDLWTMYEYYNLAANPKKSLSDEIMAIFADTDASVAINDFKKFCELYYDKVCWGNDKIIFSLWYSPWSMYWRTIATAAFKTNYKETDELLNGLRRFYYLYWIAGKTMTQIKQMSFNIVKWIKEGRAYKEIDQDIEEKMKIDNIQSLVEMNISGDVYFERWLKPLLLTIEYHQTDGSKVEFVELNNHVHAEHILPVEFSKFKEWSHFTKEKADLYLNRLGNLTLLSGKKNIEASNNPFEVKKEIYKGLGKYKNKKDGLTSFDITQKILNDQIQNWDEAEIIKRHNWYLSNVEDILRVKLEKVKLK